MKKIIFLLLLLISFKGSFSQCVTTTSYSTTYVSTDGAGNCTFTFQPVVTIQSLTPAVNIVRYTFNPASPVIVCYSGNPVSFVNCAGPLSDMPSGENQVFPAATVVIPCASTRITMTASQAYAARNTCTTQLILNGPLPVKLRSFTGASTPAGVQLNWATEWESQHEGFGIQKSTDAKSFETIGYVKGHITTDQLSTYEFLDKDVLTGQTYYYRLNQKDVNGVSDYSSIIAVRYSEEQEPEAKVFPNATTGSFMLSMPHVQSATLKLYNPAGMEVPVTIHKMDDPSLVSISVDSSVPNGIYTLHASSSNGATQKSIKVIFQ